MSMSMVMMSRITPRAASRSTSVSVSVSMSAMIDVCFASSMRSRVSRPHQFGCVIVA